MPQQVKRIAVITSARKAITKAVRSSITPQQLKTKATSNPLTVPTIAIDTMGGDFGPPVTVPAALEVLVKYPNLHLILVGDTAILQNVLKSQSYDTSRLKIQHASQKVEMD